MFEKLKWFIEDNSKYIVIMGISAAVILLIGNGNIHDVFAPHRGR